MKKIFILLSSIFFLAGCAESLAVLSTTTGATNGKILQSSLNTAVSYGIKKGTGKSPLEHALAYAKEKNPKKKKEPCLSFIDKTNSEICAIIKKKISSTQANIKEKVQVIIEKTAITKKVVVEEKIIDSKDIFVEEEKKEINNIIKSSKSPRELALALQFEMREKSTIKYSDQ